MKEDPFGWFNVDGDIRDILVAHGWTLQLKKGSNYRYCRPGKANGVSADYCVERKTLFVFSSSTVFEPLKGYNNVGVFCLLECGSDFKLCREKLLALGNHQSDFLTNITNRPSGVYGQLQPKI